MPRALSWLEGILFDVLANARKPNTEQPPKCSFWLSVAGLAQIVQELDEEPTYRWRGLGALTAGFGSLAEAIRKQAEERAQMLRDDG